MNACWVIAEAELAAACRVDRSSVNNSNKESAGRCLDKGRNVLKLFGGDGVVGLPAKPMWVWLS